MSEQHQPHDHGFPSPFYSDAERQRAAQLHSLDPTLSRRDIAQTLRREADESYRAELCKPGLTLAETVEVMELDELIARGQLMLANLKADREAIVERATRRRAATVDGP